jgi:hypothetical protein
VPALNCELLICLLGSWNYRSAQIFFTEKFQIIFLEINPLSEMEFNVPPSSISWTWRLTSKEERIERNKW